MRFLLALLTASVPFAAVAKPRVAADIAPVAGLVSAVLGEPVTPVLPPGADPHHVQLKPSQARALAGAEAVFWIGPGLTPWFGKIVESAAPEAVSVELAEAPGLVERAPMFGGAHDADGEDADDDHDGHDHGGHDPHVWLDPANDLAMLERIAAVLSDLDPAGAATYRANATAAAARIEAAAAEARTLLEPAEGKALVVFHDGYAHFAAAFGVSILGTIADSAATDPGAAGMTRLHGEIAERGAACILAEAEHGKALPERLAADFGVPSAVLDPLAGPVEEVLPAMARAIAGCVGG